MRKLLRPLQQDLLDAVLRQVEHGRQLLVRVLRHREVQDLLAAVEAAPARPRQAVLQEARQGTQALQDLQAAPRDADGAAAEAHRFIGFQQHHGHALLRQADGGAKTHRARANHHHRVALCFIALLQGRHAGRVAGGFEGIRRERAGCRHGFQTPR